MSWDKLITLSIAVVGIAAAFAFVALSASGNHGQQPFDSITYKI